MSDAADDREHEGDDLAKLDAPEDLGKEPGGEWSASIGVTVPEDKAEAVRRYNHDAIFREVVDAAARQSDRYSRAEIIARQAADQVRVHKSLLGTPAVETKSDTAGDTGP